MRAKSHLLSLILLSTCVICVRGQAASHYAERELLVKWKDGPDSYAAAVGNAQIGSTVKRNFNEIGWQYVELPPRLSVRDGIEAYQALGTVASVEPNGIIEPILPPVGPAVPSTPDGGSEAAPADGAVGTPRPNVGLHAPTTGIIPNDPRFKDQWYLKKIGATNAWAATTGSTNVVVAVIDTGVDYTHPDLAPNMWRNPGETGLDANGKDKATNGIDDDDNGYGDDVHGVNVVTGSGDPMDTGTMGSSGVIYHGTFIAGLIGAVGNNGTGIAGLNWSTQIMAIREVANEWPLYGRKSLVSSLLASWDYVLTMKRRGVNIRVASNSYSLAALFSPAMRDAIAAAGNEGILAVFSAMNDSVDTDLFTAFPSGFNLNSVISVAASTASDALAAFSNYGRSTVDLAAPGENIFSTWKGSSYMTDSGTSYSCPLVSGAAALLLSSNPNLTVDQLKAALFGSVDQPLSMRGKLVTNGRLNIARALEYLTNANPPAIVIFAAPAGKRTETNEPIEVTFNRPMDHASVESALVINPQISGTFEWSDDSRSFSFRHDTPFNSTTNYTVRILGTAQDATGGTLDGDYDRAREGSPADDYVWTFGFPIPNDDFANAQLIGGTSGSVQGSNRLASWELDELSHVLGDIKKAPWCSLWYRWIAPEPGGWFTFDLTSGTSFNSLLAVYTGDRLDKVIPVAGNDNYGSRQSSRVSFRALAGTNYSVVVDKTFDNFDPNAAYNFKLAWYPTPSPSFSGSQFSQQSGVPGTKVTLTGTNFTGATSVLFNGASASFANAPTNNFDLRITAVVPPDAVSGPITIATPHGNATTTVSFQVLPPPLTIRLTSVNELEIAWPATSPEFVLETSETLSAGSWTPVTPGSGIGSGQSKLTLPAPIGKRFFRLKTK